MFLTRLSTDDVPPNLWLFTKPLIWRDAKYGHVEFPTGTLTDLGSTPQRLRRFRMFDPTGPSRRPAAGHDFLYRHGRWPGGAPVTRKEADQFLYDAMRAEGIGAVTCWAWYRGVRMGGWVPWNRYRRADAL